MISMILHFFPKIFSTKNIIFHDKNLLKKFLLRKKCFFLLERNKKIVSVPSYVRLILK